jgi:predicted DNA-binding transcriptional regulator AlpA
MASTDELLDKAGVAALLKWSSPNHVDVNQHRTRAGTASVPFPEPVNPGQPVASHRWRKADIEAYRARRGPTGGSRIVTPELVAKVTELYSDNMSLDEIAAQTGVSRSTAWRVATGRRLPPSRTLARERPITPEEMALLLANPPQERSA